MIGSCWGRERLREEQPTFYKIFSYQDNLPCYFHDPACVSEIKCQAPDNGMLLPFVGGDQNTDVGK